MGSFNMKTPKITLKHNCSRNYSHILSTRLHIKPRGVTSIMADYFTAGKHVPTDSWGCYINFPYFLKKLNYSFTYLDAIWLNDDLSDYVSHYFTGYYFYREEGNWVDCPTNQNSPGKLGITEGLSSRSLWKH